MKKHLHNFFIPHEGNDYHPHILHTKRALLYSGVFLMMKVIVFAFVLLLPLRAFVMPDVLVEEQKNIIDLTNELREKKGVPLLERETKLYDSSQIKADDMVARDYFDHVSPDGQGLAYFLGRADYEYRVAGENLGMGFFQAEDLVNAWINSPTHYANLIDTDYDEIGIGLAMGEYEGMPTVYAVQHFGRPAVRGSVAGTVITDPTPVVTSVDTPEIKSTSAVVEETMTAAPVSSAVERVVLPEIVYNRDVSRVFWQQDGDKTIVTAQAYIVGDVVAAQVRVNQYSIDLGPADEPFMYQGQVTIFEPAETLFDVVMTPSISIEAMNGTVYQDNIFWHEPLVVSPTPFDKYSKAKTSFGAITSLFNVSRGIYLGFIILFAIALSLKIFVELKKQHPHVIFQTVLLIGLLVMLFEI